MDEGSAPAKQGPVSDNDVLHRTSNDGDVLNPIGRISLNTEETAPETTLRKKHLSCKTNTIFSTFNARTLVPLGRLEELSANAIGHSIDVIAIQEHRFYHPDDVLKYHTIGSHQLVTSSALKNSVNSTVGGIGFLLSPKAIDNLLTVESISPRIMVLELGGNPKTTIVCVYVPLTLLQ